MKLHLIVLAALLGFAPFVIIPPSTEQSAKSGDSKLGTIQGEVSDSAEEPGPSTVIIDDGTVKREKVTNEDGRFTIQVPPGVYTAYVEPSERRNEERVQHAPFVVEAGATAMIEVDRMSEFMYCTPAGERIILAKTTDKKGNLRGFHRPRYDSFPSRSANRKPLKVVIEYCGKTKDDHAIQYTSAVVRYDAFRIFADKILLDPRTLKLRNLGDEMGVLHHGKRLAGSRGAEADFSDGKNIVKLTPGPIPLTEGQGEIRSGTASFKLELSAEGIAVFRFEDKVRRLKLVSRKDDCLLVADASTRLVTFESVAEVTTNNRHLKASRTRIANFTVTLRDGGNNGNDHFSISIPSEHYKNSGSVTGRVEVSYLSKNDERGVAGVPRHR